MFSDILWHKEDTSRSPMMESVTSDMVGAPRFAVLVLGVRVGPLAGSK